MYLQTSFRALLLVLLAGLAAMPAAAGDVSAVLNGKSFHLGASEDWNEDNYGLGIEYEFETASKWKPRLMANGFRDSNDELSYMAGGGLYRNLLATERWHDFYVDAGLNAFLMTRRDINDNKPFPGVLPSLTIGNRHAGMNLTYLPKQAVEKFYDSTLADESMSGIVFLQFKFSIDPD